MINGEIQCIYDVNDVHTILSVKNDDWESQGSEIYALAEMFIKVIEDNNYNPDIIIDQMKSHFDYKREEENDD